MRRPPVEVRVAVVAVHARVVGEGDRLDVQHCEALDRRARAGMVVAEEGAGEGEVAACSTWSTSPVKRMRDSLGVEADAARGVAGRMDHAQAAEHRDQLAVDDGSRIGRSAGRGTG